LTEHCGTIKFRREIESVTSNSLASVDKSFRNIAEQLLKYVRSLDSHPNSQLVQGDNPRRFTNYRITEGRIYRNDNWNFVSFIPQTTCVHVNILEGDYSFLDGVTIHPDVRFPYFKVSDSYEIKSVKDVIELSYYYYLGWDADY